MNNPLQSRDTDADTVPMNTLTLATSRGPVTLRIDGDLLTVEADGCVRVERLVADREPHERIRDAVADGPLVQDIANQGERVVGAKLNADQVLAIRDDARSNPTVAKDYGVSISTIRLIKHRVTWCHV